MLSKKSRECLPYLRVTGEQKSLSECMHPKMVLLDLSAISKINFQMAFLKKHSAWLEKCVS